MQVGPARILERSRTLIPERGPVLFFDFFRDKFFSENWVKLESILTYIKIIKESFFLELNKGFQYNIRISAGFTKISFFYL